MSRKVLIADASCAMRKIIRRSLQAYGISDTETAADGDEAIGMFQTGAFDLVLTEWSIPGRSGLEVIRAIRALNAEIPILLVTSETELRGVRAHEDAGHSDYLVKPFSAAELAEKLKQFGC